MKIRWGFKPLGKHCGLSSALILLIVFAVALGSVLCETLLRIGWHNPYRNEGPDRVLKLPIHHANTDHIFDRSVIDSQDAVGRFRTDDRSYVMPSRRFAKPDATVVFLGGSTTECFAVQENLRFPARVSYLLEEKGLRVHTLNGGRSGNTIHDAINVLFNHAIQDDPDVVVLMEVTNDIGFLKEYRSYRKQMGEEDTFLHSVRFVLQKASSLSYFAGLFRKWLTYGTFKTETDDRSRDKNLISGDDYEKRLRVFVRSSRAFGIQPVLMTQPASDVRNALTPDWRDLTNQDAFNNIVRKVGEEEGVLVIDLVHYLKDNIDGWNEPMKIFYDGLHVTDRGSMVYSEHIAARLYSDIFTLNEQLTRPKRGEVSSGRFPASWVPDTKSSLN